MIIQFKPGDEVTLIWSENHQEIRHGIVVEPEPEAYRPVEGEGAYLDIRFDDGEGLISPVIEVQGQKVVLDEEEICLFERPGPLVKEGDQFFRHKSQALLFQGKYLFIVTLYLRCRRNSF